MSDSIRTCKYNNLFINVSVIIPVLNQEKIIESCIKSLFHQSYPQEYIEIIIVDNGSTDKTLDIIKKYPVKLKYENKKTPAAARNAGIKYATGDILIFMDSDCFAHINFVEYHIIAHKQKLLNENEHTLIAGSIAGKNSNLWAVCDDICSWYTSHPKLPPRYEENFLPTANMSVPAAVIKKIGGFDDNVLTGEDVLFCDKAKKNGYKIFFEPGAVVYHYNKNTFSGFINHAKNWTKNELELRKRNIEHPRDSIKKVHQNSAKQKLTCLLKIINFFTLLLMYMIYYFKVILKIIKYSLLAGRYYVFLLLPFILLNKAVFGFYTLKADITYRAELKKAGVE